MFDSNFTFAAPRSSQTPSTPGYSPCTSPTPYTAAAAAAAAHFSISDLADQFAGQRIERRAQICYDPCQSYSNDTYDDDESNWLIPPFEACSSSSTTALHRAPQRPHSPSQRRTQRQANARLLCSAAHREEIAALVARMVDAEEQCLVASSPLSPSSPDEEEEDEGYNSGDDSLTETVSRSSSIVAVPLRVERRRASDLVAGGACVSKSIRVRKPGGRQIRRVRTADLAE